MTLAELQRLMQESVLSGGAAALPLVKTPRDGTAAARLDVYQKAFDLRHAEFLGNDFPLLRRFMGDTPFARLARAYARAHTSHMPNARWFSQALPGFLAATQPFARKPEFAELATLEQALNDVFDAADQPHVTLAELASVDPETFAGMALDIVPAARLLRFQTNAASIWSSLKVEESPPSAIIFEVAQDVIVWRQALASRFRLLGAEETMALQSARQGVPFGIICEMIATFGDPETAGLRAASYLRGWIESELVVSLRRADACNS